MKKAKKGHVKGYLKGDYKHTVQQPLRLRLVPSPDWTVSADRISSDEIGWLQTWIAAPPSSSAAEVAADSDLPPVDSPASSHSEAVEQTGIQRGRELGRTAIVRGHLQQSPVGN